jgi:hypothetical protein
MKPIRHTVEQLAVRTALLYPSPEGKKTRLTSLYEAGVISPSMLHWAIAVNGLRGE